MDDLDKIKVFKHLLENDYHDKKSDQEYMSVISDLKSLEISLISIPFDDLNGLSSSTSPYPSHLKLQISTTLARSMNILSIEQLEYFDTNECLLNLSPTLLGISDCPGLLPQSQNVEATTPNRKFKVRSLGYTHTRSKILSDFPLFALRGIQVLRCSKITSPIALQNYSGLPKYYNNNEWLIVNYIIPGANTVNIICYFTASDDAKRALDLDSPEIQSETGWMKLLKEFWKGDQTYCDKKFKLIPSIVNGPFVVKTAVGNKPVLTGLRVQQEYHRIKNIFEIDVNISSSSMATNILKLVSGASKSIVIDLGIVLQGDDNDELPERILCQSRFSCVDFASAEFIQID